MNPRIEYDIENRILAVRVSDEPMAYLSWCCENTHVEYRKGGLPRAFVFSNVDTDALGGVVRLLTIHASARETLKRIPILNDPIITEAMRDLEEPPES